MATVDSSLPRTGSAPTSPIQRKPVPAQTSPQRRENAKPLPAVPMPEGSRVGQSPVSPVKFNFQQGNWHQPSIATIETENHDRPRSSGSLGAERQLTPQASALPSHNPQLEFSQPEGTTRRAVATSPERSQGRMNISGPMIDPTFGDEFNLQLDSKFGINAAAAPDSTSTNQTPTVNEDNRHSRETDASASTPSLSNPHTSTDASVVTSASSVSNSLENDQGGKVEDASTASPIPKGPDQAQLVPQLQYHHQPFVPSTPVNEQAPIIASTPDLSENGAAGGRHLTPTSQVRRTSMPRPQSTYSVHSDRSRSSLYLGNTSVRAPSSQSTARRSPDNRQSTYAELLSVPYPQPAPAPLTIDNSQLRNVVGSNASLLSSQKTLEMYRQNVKKTNDFSIQYSFAIFLISTAQEQGLDIADTQKKPSPKRGHNRDGSSVEGTGSEPHELVREARAILQKLANAGYPFAQYYLADGYASGLFGKGKEDYNSAFPLFVLAAKHGHAESAYRTGLCYEFGWGCRKDPTKAVQFLRTAASKRHPGAMTRLGKACLSGDLGEKRYREGLKWLKLASESADAMYNAAPYHLGCLYETGYGEDIFKDEGYAAELFTQSAELGHPEANYRMGDAYEHGKLHCPRDPALSVHFYTGAAERGHAGAMMGLCAWYLIGAEPILEKDEEEACEWARRSAELGYVKAQYAIGYFTEMGIGCRRDILEANVWYVKAAEAGDERAQQRLNAIRAAASGGKAMEVAPPKAQNLIKRKSGTKEENCVVM
ncbi:Protein SKT5 [Cytospora mali]|uniref:Protein SKT5 n=1 Tax=Cytospora mali TaxID=578113 RepID=A0A194UQF7_CYTMA|nr:Protein SKT5 [Valsa mali var. pyri (nom. inval.)]